MKRISKPLVIIAAVLLGLFALVRFVGSPIAKLVIERLMQKRNKERIRKKEKNVLEN